MRICLTKSQLTDIWNQANKTPDILGDGKFKAVPKAKWEMVMKDKAKIPDTYKQTFDISIKKSAGQQAIRLTPEIKAMIRGEAPKLKK